MPSAKFDPLRPWGQTTDTPTLDTDPLAHMPAPYAKSTNAPTPAVMSVNAHTIASSLSGEFSPGSHVHS